MAEQYIRANDLGDRLRRRLREDTELVRAVALEVALKAEGAAVRATNNSGLVDQGQFKASWVHRSIPKGAEVGNTAPHASTLEHGRRPGRPGPPFAPIREWVARKLVPEGKVTGPDGSPPTEADIDQAAWAIRNAIHIRGSKPHLLLKGLEPRIARWFRREARRRLRRKSQR